MQERVCRGGWVEWVVVVVVGGGGGLAGHIQDEHTKLTSTRRPTTGRACVSSHVTPGSRRCTTFRGGVTTMASFSGKGMFSGAGAVGEGRGGVQAASVRAAAAAATATADGKGGVDAAASHGDAGVEAAREGASDRIASVWSMVGLIGCRGGCVGGVTGLAHAATGAGAGAVLPTSIAPVRDAAPQSNQQDTTATAFTATVRRWGRSQACKETKLPKQSSTAKAARRVR
jgi:hypothetical protein